MKSFLKNITKNFLISLFNAMKKYIGLLAILEFLRTSVTSVSGDSIDYYYYPTPEIVCPCKYRYNPVCGSDGLTYFNKCILECENKNDQLKGYPPLYESNNCKECVCRKVDLPVCAQDGTTYANECELDCINRNRINQGLSIIYLSYRKRCLGPSCDCNNIASPVCGTDDVLYRSECVLTCASGHAVAQGLPEIYVKNVGACRDGCSCPTTRQPVCGSDGKTYHNPCVLECENDNMDGHKTRRVQPLYNGKCDDCYCRGPREPVCANDGTTFDNQCMLDCENQKRYYTGQPLLQPLGAGECITCVCKTGNDPVCGTDKETYGNDCVRQCENKSRRQRGQPGVDLLYKGECEETAEECVCNHCSNTYDPMCGSDYASYWNYCWLECFSQCNKAQGKPEVHAIHYGECV